MFLATNSLIIVFMSFSTTSTNPFTLFSNNRLHFCNQYHQPIILFLASTTFVTHFVFSFTTMCFSNSTTTSINHLCSFLALFVNKQQFNSFFQQPAFQPNLFISIQQFHFLVFYRSSLNFFCSALPFLMTSLQGEPCRGSSHPSSR